MANQTERLRVYLACRPIFSGEDAKLRRAKKVTQLVRKKKGALASLLRDMGEDKLVAIIRGLLEGHIFASELRAKVEFPDLFRSSPSRDAQRQASEIEAAQSAAEALEDIASQDGGGAIIEESGVSSEQEAQPDVPEKEEPRTAEAHCPKSLATSHPTQNMPLLYPSYLPYKTQHSILTTAQQTLEECCFDFAMRKMPSILEEKGWKFPVAGELTAWVRILRRQREKADIRAESLTCTDGERQSDVFSNVSTLRHTAVHRIPTTARAICKLLDSAVKLAQMLQDDERAAQLDDMRSELETKIKDLELNKGVLEDTVTAGMLEIQNQREALDRREAELIEGMVEDDLRNMAFVGELLEEHVLRTFGKGKRVLVPHATEEDLDYLGREEKPQDGGHNDHEVEAVKAEANLRRDDDYDYKDLDKMTAGIWNELVKFAPA